MSERHPIIAITGSSGAGTSTVTRTFQNIFRREAVKAAIVEGDSFHRYTRAEMKVLIEDAEREGKRGISHFGPDANLLPYLESLFRAFGEAATGRRRYYIHNEAEAMRWNLPLGTFTGAAARAPAMLYQQHPADVTRISLAQLCLHLLFYTVQLAGQRAVLFVA